MIRRYREKKRKETIKGVKFNTDATKSISRGRACFINNIFENIHNILYILYFPREASKFLTYASSLCSFFTWILHTAG